MDRQLTVSDGCARQYDGVTQHHQTAEWQTSTANWPEARQQAVAAAVERAAATSEAEREAAVAKKSAADAGIVHVHVKKVESHGKARATDGESNVVTFTIRDAIESGAL